MQETRQERARCPRCFSRHNLTVWWRPVQPQSKRVYQVLRCGDCPPPPSDDDKKQHCDWLKRQYEPAFDKSVMTSVPLCYVISAGHHVWGLCFDCGQKCDMTRGYGEMVVQDELLQAFRNNQTYCESSNRHCCTTHQSQTVIFCPLCYHNWYAHQKPLLNNNEMHGNLCVYWWATRNGQLALDDSQTVQEAYEVIHTV